VVDDEADLAESMRAVLESAGYRVVTAANGEQGYAAAKSERPDVMLLDVMMTHDTEGFELVSKLHADADTKNTPIVMITGIRKAKRLPFRFEPDPDWLPVKAVLEKPVKPEALLKNVEEALRAAGA
jgi:CheY-like chemotaxis protein